MIEVLAQGTEVLIGENIEGKITAITIRDNNIIYEITWWDGRIRRCEWFQPNELRVKVPVKIKLGFKQR